MAAFPGGEPRKEKLELVICKHCRRNVLKLHAKEHISACLKAKQDKARRKKEAREAANQAKSDRQGGGVGGLDLKDEDLSEKELNTDAKPNPAGTRKSAKTAPGSINDDSTKKSKKRKAEGDEDRSEPKKKKNKKDEPKPKAAPKPKGPVDVEKQCGVILPNGAQCARSLTCKSHSMGAKRSVPGRSLPYDMLLQAYQKKNQAKQQSKATVDRLPLFFFPFSSSSFSCFSLLIYIHRSGYLGQCSRPLRLRSRRSFQPPRWTHRFRLRTRYRHDGSCPPFQSRLLTRSPRLQLLHF